MVAGMPARAILTRKLVELAGAVAAGIGLWRFTSGDWIGGIAFTLAVGAVVAWHLLSRRATPGGRRY
jgi:hypothetical protein